VINDYPADLAPILEAIADRAARLCESQDARILLVDGDVLRYVAGFGEVPFVDPLRPLTRGLIMGRAVIDRTVVHVEDLAASGKEFPEAREYQRRYGHRTTLAVPLVREDKALGVILLRRGEVRPFDAKHIELVKAFADQAAVAIENLRLSTELKARNAELTEALEQQTATAEILRAISSSPTDIQPVLDAVVRTAARLCAASDVIIRRVDGEVLRIAAHFGSVPVVREALTIDPGSFGGRAVLERRTIHIEDLAAASDYPISQESRSGSGARTVLVVPLMREGTAIGTIAMRRPEVRPFSDQQIKLLETFAAQAVIAIENVRLFNETKEALEQQTATAEILRVISSSPTDIQPVLEAVAHNAARLCGANDVVIRLLDGDVHHGVAHYGPIPIVGPLTLHGSIAGRAMLNRKTVQIEDLLEPSVRAEFHEADATVGGYRTFLASPLIREDTAIGAIVMRREQVSPFTNKQIALLETFAAQAVIAIENVRLFNETKEALEQQTATAEILRVISSSPTDLQPVFDAILEKAIRLCDAHMGHLGLYDGEEYRFVAQRGGNAEYVKYVMERGPFRPLPGGGVARMLAERQPIQATDLKEGLGYREGLPNSVALVEIGGARAFILVPMVKEGRIVGGIAIYRTEVRPFTQKQIDLVSTFANQAVIAIENVRLFNETKEALEQQTVISEILQVISSSPTNTQPVFDAIVKSGARLFGGMTVGLRLVKGDYIETVASTVPVHDTGGPARVKLGDESLISPRAILRREVVQVPDILAPEEWVGARMLERAKQRGWRAIINAPMLREDRAIGTVSVWRTTPGPFTDKQIALLKTFADQAVIAIENVRLFKELQARNAEITEALERQTATSEILSVISQSPTDVAPVFETIMKNAVRLCGSPIASIYRYDGELVHNVATHNWPPEALVGLTSRYPCPPHPALMGGRIVLAKSIVRIPDVLADSDYDRDFAAAGGWRRIVGVPLMRGETPIGAFAVAWPDPGETPESQVALLKTFADQAVIAIENVRLFKELQARNTEITEALDQQTATAEILRVISSSPTNVQPVLEAVAEYATRVCDAGDAGVNLIDGAAFRLAAHYGAIPAVTRDEAIPLNRGTVVGRAILERRPVHVPDLLAADDFPEGRILGERFGNRTTLAVPLLREGTPIGALLIRRTDVRPFTDKQIKLLETFAAQAVIAIENVRLFNETKEALEQQTVISEILSVISSSPTDTQPVFDAIVKSGVHLFGGLNVSLRLVKGDQTEEVASTIPLLDVDRLPLPLDDERISSARAILRREVVQIPDLFADDRVGEEIKKRAERRGYRAVLSAPMLRENSAIGAITVSRASPGTFTDKQVALLKTFAAQAVIAIENVRLFKELQARNTEITESLEQQTATADILSVISSSPTELQPVFDTILEKATRLCDAHLGLLGLYDGETFEVVGQRGANVEFAKWLIDRGPFRPGSSGGVITQMIAERRPIHIPDHQESPAYRERKPNTVAFVELGGARTYLAVPMLKDGRVIGAITIYRPEVRPFTQKQIDLVSTFANQAVIAIENVRLFKELQARNAEITESLEQQTATAEILRVISSSPTNVQPVFDAIVKSGVHLFGGLDVSVLLAKGDQVELTASTIPPDHVSDLYPLRLNDDGTVACRAILSREVVHVPDVLTQEWTSEKMKRLAERRGFRAVMAAPLMREGNAIGVIAVTRARSGPFTDKQIALLKTFADQAVIAIENVRLFNETKEALEQQTVISEILRVISSSPTDVQPVFDAIVKSGVHLFAGMNVSLRLVKGDHIETVASTLPVHDTGGVNPVALGDESMPASRALLHREVVQIPDILDTEEWVSAKAIQRGKQRGFRAIMIAPMLRENNAVGGISVTRASPGPFSDKQVGLLKTFADQAVIAIENVRLFKELQARNAEITESLEQQTATSEILRVISSSPTDLQPVFDSILEHAARLCDGNVAALGLYDGEKYQHVAQRGASPDHAKYLLRGPFDPETTPTLIGPMVREGRTIHVPDIRDTAAYRDRVPVVLKTYEFGARSVLAVPIMKDGRVAGGIFIFRPEARPFTQKQIDLVSTFANQAVIAIENVRLFKELEARNAEITEALQQQTATSEILQVISSSPTDVTPVLEAVAHRAALLCDTNDARVYVVDGDALRYVGGFGDLEGAFLTLPLTRKLVVGRAVIDRSIVHIDDLVAVLDEFPDARGPQQSSGTRTTLAVPLMRENEAFGALLMRRKDVRPFTEKHIQLVKTFAHQAAIGIENVRLFKEIQEKGRQLEIANKHKSEFLANMSHELRTPLNAVIGFSEALIEKMFGELNAKQEDYLKDIHSSGRHLLSLINDILDLSKIEAGRMELELSDFSLPAALKNAMTLVRERAQTHSIEMKLHVDPKLGDIRADERKFKQIVLNLLSNAVKFTPNGGRVEVDARRNGGSLKVSVKDTGVGIATKDQAALFEEFRQVGRGSTGKREGTGLGLALTRRFVELHGGKIGVESKPGKGSTFTFTLPLKTLQ